MLLEPGAMQAPMKEMTQEPISKSLRAWKVSGRGGEDRSQDALDQRQNHDHPGLGLRVVEIPSDVGQLDVGSAMDHLDRQQVRGKGTRALTTEEGPWRATTWTKFSRKKAARAT